MKLLITGSNYSWSIEKIYYKHLQEAGVELELFPSQNFFYGYYNQSIIHKIIYRSGFSSIIKEINEKLKNSIGKFRPDAVWVFKGMEILPKTLEWIKEKNIFLANYNPDNPFIFSGKGSGNKNVSRSISLYDLHFTYNLHVQQELDEQGFHTAFLPFGYELDKNLFDECSRQEELNKVCFVGNPDKLRASFISTLADKGIEIDVYGYHWKNFVKNDRVKIFNPVLADEFWKTLFRYRVQLNIMRLHNEDSHNMRSFEIPAIGGVMLAPDTTEHRMFFEKDKEAFLFSDVNDCANQIGHILKLEKKNVDFIRQAARERSVKSGYDYKQRTQIALQYFLKNL